MKKVLLGLMAVMVFVGCSKEEPQENITVIVSSDYSDVYNGLEVTFTANTTGGNTKEATFYLNGQSIGSSISHPYNIKHQLKDIEPGNHTVTCIVKSENGNDFEGKISISLSLRLGDEYQGGKIFKLNADGKSGLIASVEDLSYNGDETFVWGMPEIVTGATSDDGKTNTALMISNENSPNHYFAAYHFKDGYNYNGYSDWYIPSYTELQLLRENKSYVGNFSNLTNWSNSMYWSSTESTSYTDSALAANFNVLMGNPIEKGKNCRIRPIRKF